MPKTPDQLLKDRVSKKKQLILDQRRKKKLFYSDDAAAKKKKSNLKVIEKKEDLTQFIKNKSCKLDKIEKRTKFLVTLDKYRVRDTVDALRAYYVENYQEISPNTDMIHLMITISKPLAQATIKPISVPVFHQIYAEKYGSLSALVTRNKDSRINEGFRAFCEKNRIKTFTIERFSEILRDSKKALQLLKTWDTLYCDEELYNIIRKKGYKLFMKRKKLPFPVQIDSFAESYSQLQQSVYLCKSQGPVFSIDSARVRMSNKEAVKNIMNLVYKVIPHLLTDSEKNTQVLHIGLRLADSKILEIYKNSHKWQEEEQPPN